METMFELLMRLRKEDGSLHLDEASATAVIRWIKNTEESLLLAHRAIDELKLITAYLKRGHDAT